MKLVPGRGDAGLDPGPLERVDGDGHLAVRWTLRLGVLVVFAVAGACGVCALMYGVLAVKLMIVDMLTNECSGSQCPRGMTPVFLLAFAFGFVSVWVARLGGKTAGTVSARTLAAVLVFGVLAGVWLGLARLRLVARTAHGCGVGSRTRPAVVGGRARLLGVRPLHRDTRPYRRPVRLRHGGGRCPLESRRARRDLGVRGEPEHMRRGSASSGSRAARDGVGRPSARWTWTPGACCGGSPSRRVRRAAIRRS